MWTRRSASRCGWSFPSCSRPSAPPCCTLRRTTGKRWHWATASACWWTGASRRSTPPPGGAATPQTAKFRPPFSPPPPTPPAVVSRNPKGRGGPLLLGAPPITLFEVTPQRGPGGAMQVQIGGQTLVLPDPCTGLQGRACVLGVRPEDL